jgi:hypothetical protein
MSENSRGTTGDESSKSKPSLIGWLKGTTKTTPKTSHSQEVQSSKAEAADADYITVLTTDEVKHLPIDGVRVSLEGECALVRM